MNSAIKITLGVLLAVGTYVLCRSGVSLEHPASITAAITALCAAWWCTEALPIPVTSIVPFVAFPLAGILDYAQLSGAWGNKFILLFMGGFMISKAAEKSNAHLRVASGMVRLVGTGSNKRLIIGFMLATAFSSMWISNTATALIMLPVAIAVIQQNPGRERFAICLLLAIAYGASVGGVATIIGTPPNGIMVSMYERYLADGTEVTRTIDFLSWMKVGLPVSLVMLGVVGTVLTFRVKGGSGFTPEPMGAWTPAQILVVAVITCTAILWITRLLPFGWGGWSVWLDVPMAHDATVALLAVLAFFLIPSFERDESGRMGRLLDWETARNIPWGILLLFAGGLAIAEAFKVTHLADDIGAGLSGITGTLHPMLVILVICLAVTFTTEVTSNTATTTLFMPVLASAASASGVEPAVFMVPAALSASCAFMLPVATPPNAIVFGGSKRLTIGTMARYGFFLNLIGAVVITLVCSVVLDQQHGLLGPGKPTPVEQPSANIE